jgi:hypothetical protein
MKRSVYPELHDKAPPFALRLDHNPPSLQAMEIPFPKTKR